MARLTVKGLDEISATLDRMGKEGRNIAKAAVYAGADKMISQVKEEINSLTEQSGYVKDGDRRNVVKPWEKQALLDHVGISHMDETGDKVSTAIGFNGYADYPTKKYPGGVPVPLIARSIESGSSVRQKNAFLRRAKNNADAAAKAAMVEAARAYIDKIK